MADIQVKGKRGNPTVDLTPMVDLGFLLITFFVFTTTMNKPKAMEIQMPYTDGKEIEDPTVIKKDVALTILLSKDHRIYYYEGIGNDPEKAPDVEVTGFQDNGGIRDILIKKKLTVQSLIQQGVLKANDLTTVIIKPDVNSSTDDLINIIDEMTINAIPVYAVVDITPGDKEFITLTEEKNKEN